MEGIRFIDIRVPKGIGDLIAIPFPVTWREP